MGTQYARFEEFLKRRTGKRAVEIALEPQLLLVAGAYDAVDETRELSDTNLQLFIQAMRDPHMILWANACELLGWLAGRFPAATQAIVMLSRDNKSHVRFAALCAVSVAMPEEIVAAILRAGLKDRSANVRWKASERLRLLERYDLVPELTTAANFERNARTATSLNFDLLLLRDGYILKRSGPEGFDLTVATPRVSSSRWISETEINSKGIDQIVENIRKSLEKQHPRIAIPMD